MINYKYIILIAVCTIIFPQSMVISDIEVEGLDRLDKDLVHSQYAYHKEDCK